MWVTKRAARFAFAVLLLGAGAAAVAARPSERVGELEVVQGDPRLDLAWALTETGMAASDAFRVSVILVDGVDPNAELEVMTVSRGAELWWRHIDQDGTTSLRMMRVRIDRDWGGKLNRLVKAEACPGDECAFVAVRTTKSSPAPIPPGTVVLLRVGELWLTRESDSLRPSAFEPLHGYRDEVECQPLGIDVHYGIATPTRWPVAP